MHQNHLRSLALIAAFVSASTLVAQAAPAPAPAPAPGAAPAAAAPQKPTDAQVTAAIDTLRTEIASIRKQTVAYNMTFTDQQATAFWPLYDAYRLEIKKSRDVEWNVIKTYAMSAGAINDSLAQSMVTQMMSARKTEMDVKSTYAPKFAAILGWTKTARFYQVEAKLDAMQDFNRAKQIPLVTSK